MRPARSAAARTSGDAVPIAVEHLPLKLDPDPRRVIMRFFGDGRRRSCSAHHRPGLEYPETEGRAALVGAGGRLPAQAPEAPRDLRRPLRAGPRQRPGWPELTRSRRLLLGACFTMEYALESVALFNPSIVPALRQDGVPPGSVRFVMSLRATGEGHVSSIIFRVGLIDARGISNWSRPVLMSGRSRRPCRTNSRRRCSSATWSRWASRSNRRGESSIGSGRGSRATSWRGPSKRPGATSRPPASWKRPATS